MPQYNPEYVVCQIVEVGGLMFQEWAYEPPCPAAEDFASWGMDQQATQDDAYALYSYLGLPEGTDEPF